jgi:hypothetical protein
MTWSWTAHVYFVPTSVTTTLCRGRAVVVTAELTSEFGFAASKTWRRDPAVLSYAQLPGSGRTGMDVAGDRALNRPFLTIESGTWGTLSDLDVMEVTLALRAAPHGNWPIAKMAKMDSALVTVDRLDPDRSSDAEESALVRREDGQWKLVHTELRGRAATPPVVRHFPLPRIGLLAGVFAVALAAGLVVFGFWIVSAARRRGGG